MKPWMLVAISAEVVLTALWGSAAPIRAAPSSVPSQEYWLKLRSLRVPTSVTKPTFRSDEPAGALLVLGLWALTALPRARLVAATTTAAEVIRVLRIRSSCMGWPSTLQPSAGVGTTGSSTGRVHRILAGPLVDRQSPSSVRSESPGLLERPSGRLSVVRDRDADVVDTGLDGGIAPRVHRDQLDGHRG